VDISDIGRLIIVISFITGILKYKYLSSGLKYLFWFIAYGVANEISVEILGYFDLKQRMMPQRHLYTFISFLLLGLFYNSVLKGFFKRNWILLIIILFEIYFLINSFFISGIFEYPGFARSISIFILVSFSVIYFYKTMIEAKIKKLFNEPLIWINTGVLLYFSGNLFFNILFDIIFEYSKEFGLITYFYFNVLNIIFYALLAIGFWKIKPLKRKKKSRQISSMM
jgi:hypothetical protein